MNKEFKEDIIDKIRREHNLVIKKGDPLFAIVTANEMVLQEQIKQIHKIFEEQQISSEIATQNYLNQAKEILTHLCIKASLKQNKNNSSNK